MQLYCKKILVQVFSCEFCIIFKNAMFYRTPPVAASVSSVISKRISIKGYSYHKELTLQDLVTSCDITYFFSYVV